MTDQAVETGPLAAFASPLAPVVVRLGDADAVVLTTIGGAEIQVWTKDRVTTLAGDTVVWPVTDLRQADITLRQAVISLNIQRCQAQKALTDLVRHHDTTLAAIRNYAIEAHRDGDICEGGLNEFLRTFEMDEYDPRVSLSYTMAGSFILAGSDEQAVREAVITTLAPDYSLIRFLKDDTTYHRIESESLRPVRLDDGQTGFEVAFVITGEYHVRYRDTDDAEADCQRYLCPSLSSLPTVLLGSISYAVTDIDSELVY